MLTRLISTLLLLGAGAWLGTSLPQTDFLDAAFPAVLVLTFLAYVVWALFWPLDRKPHH